MRNRYIFLLAAAFFFWTACKKKDLGSAGLGGTITLVPNSGLAGTVVTIEGKGFGADTGALRVLFNGATASVQVVTDTQLLVTVPEGTTGPVTVRKGGHSVTGPVYTYQKLSITGISPATGPSGIYDTITGVGLNFSGSVQSVIPAVYFNGHPAKVISADSNRIVAVVPDTAGVGPVTVALGDEKGSGPVFNFLGVVGLSPLTGNAGTIVQVLGGFGANYASATVTLGGKPATVLGATQTDLIFAVPKGDTTGQVIVQVSGQSLPGPVFTFVPPPQLSQLLPSSGPAGTRVVISGKNFSAIPTEDTVRFNGVLATVVSASATQVTVISPTGAGDGPVTVLVNGQNQVQTLPYKFQSLGITAINPVNAFPPVPDTVHGFGFGTVAANVLVQFNAVPVQILSVVDTQIIVSVPGNVTSGVVTVQVGSLSATGPVFSTAGVSTFAGGSYGLQNGKGTQAQFRSPTGIAIDATGNVYVCDQGANNIRKITPDGTVTTFAGDPNGGSGLSNGIGTAALFNAPNDIAFDKQGNLYVADQGNTSVRKIAPDGTVTTLAPIPHGDQPWGVAVDPQGNVWASDWSGSLDNDYQFDLSGNLLQTLSMNAGARLDGIVIDPQGNVYTVDRRFNGLFKNKVSVQTNFSQYYDKGVCLDNSGNIIVIDGGWNQVDLVDPTTFAITVITGGGGNGGTLSGYQDGVLGTALFSNPLGAKVDAQGNIYVADQGNSAVRKISLK